MGTPTGASLFAESAGEWSVLGMQRVGDTLVKTETAEGNGSHKAQEEVCGNEPQLTVH